MPIFNDMVGPQIFCKKADMHKDWFVADVGVMEVLSLMA